MDAWQKELLERFTNTRFDETTGDITGEVWPGPYGWRMHRDWLFAGANDTLNLPKFSPVLDPNSVSLPPEEVGPQIKDALNAGVPNFGAGFNPRTDSVGGGTPPPDPEGSEYGTRVQEGFQHTFSTGVLGTVGPFRGRLFYQVLRAQILRKERQACKSAIEVFAKRVEDDLIAAGVGIPAGTIVDMARDYNQSPQDPIPGGEWY